MITITCRCGIEFTGIYAERMQHNLSVYPDTRIIVCPPMPVGDKHGWATDEPRLRAIAYDFDGEDVFYYDADALVGEAFTGADRPQFYNMIGGVRDYCGIFKPAGSEAFFQQLYKDVDWKKNGDLCRLINGKYYSAIGALCGYPDFKYIKHTGGIV